MAVMACPSEPFGAQQSVGQVDQQPDGHERGQCVIENQFCLLKPVAGVGIGNRRHKEDGGQYQDDHVHHDELLLQERPPAAPARTSKTVRPIGPGRRVSGATLMWTGTS